MVSNLEKGGEFLGYPIILRNDPFAPKPLCVFGEFPDRSCEVCGAPHARWIARLADGSVVGYCDDHKPEPRN